MRRIALILALAAAAAPALSANADAAGDWQMIPSLPDDHVKRADQVPLHPASGGLALSVVDGLWHLVPLTLGVRFRSPTDQDFVVVAAKPADALVYLHLPGLVAGKVDSADMRFKGVTYELDKPSLAIPFKGALWRLEAKAGKLTLTDGAHRQAMGSASDESDMRTVRLVWAGDLDRDGKPDFLVDTSSDDDGWQVLYLSSRAKPGDFVGEAVQGYRTP